MIYTTVSENEGINKSYITMENLVTIDHLGMSEFYFRINGVLYIVRYMRSFDGLFGIEIWQKWDCLHKEYPHNEHSTVADAIAVLQKEIISKLT